MASGIRVSVLCRLCGRAPSEEPTTPRGRPARADVVCRGAGVVRRSRARGPFCAKASSLTPLLLLLLPENPTSKTPQQISIALLEKLAGVPPEKRTGAAEAQERQRRRAAQQQASAGPFGALFGAAAAAGHGGGGGGLRGVAGGGGASQQQSRQHPGLPAPSERVGELLLTHEKGEAEAVRRLADELLGGERGGEETSASAASATTTTTSGSSSKGWITAPRAAPPCGPEREAAVACYLAALAGGGKENAGEQGSGDDPTSPSRRLLACGPVVDAYARCASLAFERQQAAEERARGQRAVAALAARG